MAEQRVPLMAADLAFDEDSGALLLCATAAGASGTRRVPFAAADVVIETATGALVVSFVVE